MSRDRDFFHVIDLTLDSKVKCCKYLDDPEGSVLEPKHLAPAAACEVKIQIFQKFKTLSIESLCEAILPLFASYPGFPVTACRY